MIEELRQINKNVTEDKISLRNKVIKEILSLTDEQAEMLLALLTREVAS